MDWIYRIQRHASLTSSECRAIACISFILILGSTADLFLDSRTPKLPSHFAPSPVVLDTLKTKSTNPAKTDSLLKVQSSESQDSKEERKQTATDRININTANRSQLIKLKGIGPSLANRIIAFRNERGPFKSTKDLKKVKGIGKGKMAAIENFISIESEIQAKTLSPSDTLSINPNKK